jgi:phosphate transport system substrate-binding protein
MKKISRFFLLHLFCFSIFLSSCNQNREQAGRNKEGQLHGKISISGAFALYPLAVLWSEEYTKVNPKVTFDIQGGGAGKGMTDALSGTVDIGMVSRSINSEEVKKGAYAIAVAKDAVVPTINADNPWISEILKRGMTQKQFKAIWMEGKVRTWGELLGTNAQEKIEVYTRSDAAGAPETWAKYLDGRQEDLLGTGVFADPGLAEVVSKTINAVGFNNINYAYDGRTKKTFSGLQVIPIDLNENGTLDPDENFYSTIDELNKAIVDGRFPSPPARDLYFVTKGMSFNPVINDFLSWVLSDGQKFVSPAGYVQLADSILITEKNKLE